VKEGRKTDLFFFFFFFFLLFFFFFLGSEKNRRFFIYWDLLSELTSTGSVVRIN